MSAASLPETAAVHWRPRMDEERLRLKGVAWTASGVFQAVPMLATAGLMLYLDPVTVPFGIIFLIHAWAIAELYANRGAKVVKPRPRAGEAAEATALGLLGDLVGHEARELHARTGLVLERGAFGVWLVGEAGALLVRGRRVHCWCVRATDPGLPSSDRIAHLLLALRADEAGFATVANHAFAGARWRVRRRLPKPVRPALDAARRASRPTRPRG
jgi:hypothetical protein